MLEQLKRPDTYIGGYRLTAEIASNFHHRTLLGETASRVDYQRVIIKWFDTIHFGTAEEKKCFLQLMSLYRRLQHPHILPIISYGFYFDMPYIVTPYASGGSLAERMQYAQIQLCPQELALTTITKIGQALSYVHQQNIVHGHLTAQNIMFNTYNEVQLTDFRIIAQSSQPFNYDVGATLDQATPQCIRAIRKEDDQYALATLAYELFTGQQPLSLSRRYHVDNLPGIFFAPGQFHSNLPMHIEGALLRALAPDRAERYESVDDFLYALNPPPETLRLNTYGKMEDTNAGVRKTDIAIPSSIENSRPAVACQEPLILVIPPQQSQVQSVQAETPGSVPQPDCSNLITIKGSKTDAWQRPYILFVLASLICVIIIGMTGAHFYTFLPEQHIQRQPVMHLKPGKISNPGNRQQASLTPTAHKVSAHSHPRPTPTPDARVRWHVPTWVPSPHSSGAKKTTEASNGFSVTPDTLTATMCIDTQLVYVCTVTLALDANYAGEHQSWYAESGPYLYASFQPASGSLALSNSVQVKLIIPRRCPYTGVMHFIGSTTSATLHWSC